MWDAAWDDADDFADDVILDAVVWTFDEFYAVSRSGLVRGLTLGDSDLAAEAADEALTKAYLRWNHVSQLDNPAGWTYRVGLNWARSIVRRRRGPARAVYSSTTERTISPGSGSGSLDRAECRCDVLYSSDGLAWSSIDATAVAGEPVNQVTWAGRTANGWAMNVRLVRLNVDGSAIVQAYEGL